MTSLNFSLSSSVYKSNIFTGFSQLQKQEEFVDLTLAADGCLVKVHRNLIALASPYLREILKSLASYSPVIFLNNVSQKTLAYLLEYIYNGEVSIPEEMVNAFIEASKSLHIAGIEDLEPPKIKKNCTAKRKHPTRRTSTCLTTNNVNVSEVQQYPSDSYTDNNETDFIMEDLQQSTNLINNAEFIKPDQMNNNFNSNHQIQESNVVQNISVIDTINNYASEEIHKNILDKNLIIYPTNSIHQNPTNTTIPVDITENITEQLHTLVPDYKIIVKTQENIDLTEALQNNIPVIEIQHMGISQQDTTTTEYPNTTLPIVPIDWENHPRIDQENQPRQDQENQAVPKINKPTIQILDDVVIKNAEGSIEMNADRAQILLSGNKISEKYTAKLDDIKNMAQYSMTERGALQLIMNRFIYCCHHSSTRKTRSRWRCINYRRGNCPAWIDTENGAIVARKGIHVHRYHDDEIYKKHEKGLVFYTIEEAIAAGSSKQKEAFKFVPNDGSDTE